MSNLNQELEQAKFEFNQENQRGSIADAYKVAALKAKIEDLTKRIEEQEQAAAHEAIVSTVDDMVINGTPLRELFDIASPEMAEMAYRIVSTAWKQSLLDEADKGKKQSAELSAQLTEEKESRAKLQTEYDELYEATSKLKTDLGFITQELADARAKRDSAASQLEEANKEIQRLKSQVDDLQKEIAVGAANAPKVIDINESLDAWKAAKAEAEAGRQAIYDLKPLDWKQSKYSAKLAETDEYIEFPWTEKGKYREVTAAEAEVFRAEYEAKRAKESATVDAGEGLELTPPSLQFQEGDDITDNGTSTVGGVVEGNTSLEVAREDATLEERVAALEKEVFGRVKGAA